MRFIDLRSDTVTMPTDEMREAMAKAPVGDSIFRDDPTVNKLEELAAAKVGKEDAIFLPSGTFGNQLALFTHCLRGQEIIIGKGYHIVTHEVGAPAVIAGVQLRTIDEDENGALNPELVEKAIRRDDIHEPQTGLICVENAYSGGTVVGLDNLREIKKIAEKHNLPVHLDGARLFNAALTLGVEAKEIAKCCDSVMFCVSKGLAAPMGSILAGSKDFIAKARRKQKVMGGGMRQVGIVAAAGIIAIEKMTLRLNEDHENAKYLACELNKIDGIEVNNVNPDISMVFFKMSEDIIKEDVLIKEFFERNIKINKMENGEYRFVTHVDITKEDLDYVLKTLKELIGVC
ncbi:low-specificity L-threonine aldolase [Clostridioides difficile]|uniref:Low specificity L-threonine aldolase n=6 Tax=Clostridioides difficile TaxID=1496 RepID=A0AAX3GYF5_CLODI|nr:low-specificity L-threonine aldolase [Clostridioides difficile]AVD37578.1 low-specificity L-threonine aldolase [Clostridioides difficile]AVD38971.1 low-specificity L-threonine aldolase [Clostridioides difficile]AVD42496.1 low-specificity L-threonine aldolase [Clostridioides difficile]AXU69048.1 low-specificity L-threonine aldolase [Clostridioides difficile]AXU91196.1 low-specificity L-threonine aldolase [Clostridioides difficile]